MTIETYLLIALIYYVLINIQNYQMVYNNFNLPKFYIRYFSDSELNEFRDSMKEFENKFPMLDQSQVASTYLFVTVFAFIFLSLFWPYYIFKEVVKSFSHK